jgi:hypothetical protein
MIMVLVEQLGFNQALKYLRSRSGHRYNLFILHPALAKRNANKNIPSFVF